MGIFCSCPKVIPSEEIQEKIDKARWLRLHLSQTGFSYSNKPDYNLHDALRSCLSEYADILEGKKLIESKKPIGRAPNPEPHPGDDLIERGL